VEKQAIDILQCDLVNCGGITGMKKIAALGGSTLQSAWRRTIRTDPGDRDECAVCRNHSQLPDFGDHRAQSEQKLEQRW